MSPATKAWLLEGLLVLVLFIASVIGDVVTAVDVDPSLVVVLRMTAVLYGIVWGVRLLVGGARSVRAVLTRKGGVRC